MGPRTAGQRGSFPSTPPTDLHSPSSLPPLAAGPTVLCRRMDDVFRRVVAALSADYRVEREIGRGGMATVYLARDRRLDRQVAIKVLDPTFVSRLARERFLREVDLSSKLTHPHIVPIFAAGEADGLLYYTMPFIEGETLRHRLQREGPLPIMKAVEIGIEAADALAYAHGQGIVHRDVKPENILLSGEHAVVADFGIARAVREAGGVQLTQSGIAIGTPAYMSPEQALGSGEVDGRSDIYSLGCVLYEMLSGQVPFAGPTRRAAMELQATWRPPPLRSVAPGIPAFVETVVMRALSRQPEERYPSAAELSRDLREVEAVLTTGQRSGAWGKPQEAWTKLLAYVGVLAVLVAGAYGISSGLRAGSEASDRKMLVVLPFEHLGTDEYDYFVDGITEEITSNLASIDGLGVISRTSALRFQGTPKTIQEIGNELDVEYVLEGTVRTELSPGGTGRIRVTPQLIRVSDDTHLWASRFDAALEPGDLFRVQSQIAEQVAQALDLTLFAGDGRGSQRSPTENAEAYEYYLRGLDLWNRGVLGFADNDRLLAIEMYERAVAHDPEFALAYARLAGAHSWAFSAYLDRSETRLTSAEAAAQRALELDPDLPEAMVALGWIHVSRSRDYDRALGLFQRSLEVDANHVDALYGMAWVEQRRGNLDRALELFQRRLELDPLSTHATLNVGTTFLTLRRYEEAEAYYSRAVSLAPDLYLPYARQAQLYLIWRGDGERAQVVLRDAAQKIGPSEFIVRFANDWRPLIRSLRDEYLETLENLSQSAFGADTARYHILKAMIHAQRSADHQATVHYDSARVVLERRLAIWPENPEYHSELGLAYAGLGRVEEAVLEGQRGVALARDIGNVQQANDRSQDLAEIYLLVGRWDASVDQIATLLNTASRISVPLLRVDPLWNPLRSNPRFAELLSGS